MEVELLPFSQLSEVLSLQIWQYIEDHNHHISDLRTDNYYYEVNVTNDIPLRTLILDLCIVMALPG